MGAWGIEPWANDSAADWFGGLMEKTSLRDRWLEGIGASIDDEEGEIVLAAAWLFVQLGRVYVWPVEYLHADREVTIAALKRLREDEYMAEADPEEWGNSIDAYIQELESRL